MWIVALLAMLLVVPAALAQSPGLAEFPELKEGEQLIRARKWREAEDWFYEFARANEQHAEARRKLAYVELHSPGGDLVRARQYLEAARSLEPEDPVGLMLLGRTYQIGRDYDKARTTYEKIMTLADAKRDRVADNAGHLARFNSALIALRDGDTDGAKSLFEAVLEREPNHAYALLELARISSKEGGGEETIALLEKADRSLRMWAPLEVWPYPQGRYSYAKDNVCYEMGKALVKAGRAQEARAWLEPLIGLARSRSDSKKVERKPGDRTPLEGPVDDSFVNASFYYAEVLAAEGDKRAAVKMLKEFGRMQLVDAKLKSAAKVRAKELR